VSSANRRAEAGKGRVDEHTLHNEEAQRGVGHALTDFDAAHAVRFLPFTGPAEAGVDGDD